MLSTHSFWWEFLMNDRWDENNCYFRFVPYFFFSQNIYYGCFLSARLRILKKISSRNWYQKWLLFVIQWNPLSNIHLEQEEWKTSFNKVSVQTTDFNFMNYNIEKITRNASGNLFMSLSICVNWLDDLCWKFIWNWIPLFLRGVWWKLICLIFNTFSGLQALLSLLYSSYN